MGFQVLLNLFSVSIIFCCSCLYYGTAIDTITSSQFIKDPEILSSYSGLFTLGFFSPENSTNHYVGIWLKSKSKVVWVANRNQPLSDSSGIFTISEDGNLVVLNGQKEIIWSSNVSNISGNSSARLLDSGNLELLDNTTGNTVWQNFQDPSDTLLATMKITSNKITGAKVKLTSWKSPSDPSIGNFRASLERLRISEVFIWNETHPYWRSGPWNGRSFTGIPVMDPMYVEGFNIVDLADGNFYLSFTVSSVDLTTFVLDSRGVLMETYWIDEKEEWGTRWTSKNSDCDVYGTCGAFGSCSSETSPICSCLRGFEPQNKEEWNSHNWTSGCVRKEDLQCEKVKNGSSGGKSDGFLWLRAVKVPDFAEQSSVSEDTCRNECLQNCSCMAYAYDEWIGCMSWSGNLIDIQQLSTGGIDLYLRAVYSELDRERDLTVIITITVIIGTIIIITSAYLLWKWTSKHPAGKKRRKGSIPFKRAERYLESSNDNLIGQQSQVELPVPELLQYDFEQLATATNNFHPSNKLGQGGFGPVYKGKLQDGREIAVKRLSRASGQGLEEFTNEVVVISELQHRNLVKLLGCCIEGGEKMLIYEYMPNRSLDAFVFDPPKHKLLDWKKRFHIIEGIVRGLLYLHRDSRLRIIHRDLKASNILLDDQMNPKISDFGMARIFGGNEDQANTRRVVGTYGYMSPEYAMEGLFSEKSDVFSFGVLLLEIISGRKNSSFYEDEESLSLLGFAWRLWNEESIASLIDPEINDGGAGSQQEILRCIHIGLTCVQELARERPTMATVISMLNSEIVNLAPPRRPGFIMRQSMLNSQSSQRSQKSLSNNCVSMTEIHGR